VEKSLGGEKTLVFEQGDAESDLIHAVTLLSSLDLNETLSLESTELELDFWVLGWGGSEVSKSFKTFLLATYVVS